MFRYIIITFTITASLLVYSMWCFVTSRSMLFSSFIKKPLPLPRVLNPLFHICKKELILTLTRIHLYHLSSGDLYTAAASFKQFQSQTLTRILGFEWVEGWSCEKFQSRTCQISPQYHSIQDVVVFIPFTVLTRATYSRAYYNSSSVWRRRRGCNVLKRLSQI